MLQRIQTLYLLAALILIIFMFFFPAAEIIVNNELVIGIVGAGVMGKGIAQLLARSGGVVLLCDSQDLAAEKAFSEIRETYDFLVERKKI